MQLKKHSLFEATTNLIVGYIINFIANILIFPLFDWHITIAQNLWLGVIFTFISLARQYCLRRAFTHLTEINEKVVWTEGGKTADVYKIESS